MKYILIFLSFFLLVSCFSSQKDIDEAKKELLWNSSVEENTVTDNGAESNSESQKNDMVSQWQNIQIVGLSEEQFLDFDAISDSFLSLWEVEISWKTNVYVEEIKVEFSNPTSNYPDDNYTLQTYSPEEGSFIYRASSRNKVLDYGENNYIFTAISGDAESQTKITLVVPQDDLNSDDASGVETDILGTEDNLLQINFPTASKYGEPIKLWEASFTYSGIKWFEAKKQIFEAPTCEDVTEFLRGRINTWFYWNTCRDIVKDLGIKINVLRLEDEQYIYERHYLDFKHGIYATYELERGSWVDSENIAEKNEELKEREYPSLEVVDDLMKDIVNS